MTGDSRIETHTGPLVSWFQSHHGYIDSSVIGFTVFLESGRGAVALQDIPEGHTLFTIPRLLTLSTRTSSLPAIFGVDSWTDQFQLNKGWVGLILCMMWEEAQGASSQWADYLASLPTSFDTPMFWDMEDLEELKGTSVVEKIGKDDAEIDYRTKLLPAISSRPDLFPEHLIPRHYSVERYHIMGSRILSRSFNVEKWEADEDDNEEANTSTNTAGSAMDVDDTPGNEQDANDGSDAHGEEKGDEENSIDSDDDEEEDSSDVSMVPMADMLNARYGSENAKLFYEENELKMVSTRPIKAGDQIWNTYGDLPNSDLLRRYGHVDLLPLPDGSEGNPGDVVEVRADIVVTAVIRGVDSKERIDWWLEEGGDDVFVFESDLELPEAFISLIRLLLSSQTEWEKARDKGKPPKAKIDAEVVAIAENVLLSRLNEYPTSVEADEILLRSGSPLSLNKRHAIIVRLGEKKILAGVLQKLRLLREEAESKGNKMKRKGGAEESGSRSKKTRQ